MVLDVVQKGDDPSMSLWEMLVSVAHVEVFDTLAVNETDLNKRWVLACHIDVLLCLDFAAKLTRRGIPESS